MVAWLEKSGVGIYIYNIYTIYEKRDLERVRTNPVLFFMIRNFFGHISPCFNFKKIKSLFKKHTFFNLKISTFCNEIHLFPY